MKEKIELKYFTYCNKLMEIDAKIKECNDKKYQLINQCKEILPQLIGNEVPKQHWIVMFDDKEDIYLSLHNSKKAKKLYEYVTIFGKGCKLNFLSHKKQKVLNLYMWKNYLRSNSKELLSIRGSNCDILDFAKKNGIKLDVKRLHGILKVLDFEYKKYSKDREPYKQTIIKLKQWLKNCDCYFSTKDGKWNDPATWATNAVPKSGEVVIKHKITVSKVKIGKGRK